MSNASLEGPTRPTVPKSRALTFFAIAAAGCVADLLTKSMAFGWLGMPGQRTWWLIRNVLAVQTSLNEGGLFGLGQGLSRILAVLSVAAAIAIVYWLFWGGAARELCLTVALALITAGISGNLYDRLGLHGLKWNFANPWHQVGDPVYAVRDWILVIIIKWPWPTFNLADSMLVCGALLLVWHAWRHESPPRTVP